MTTATPETKDALEARYMLVRAQLNPKQQETWDAATEAERVEFVEFLIAVRRIV